MATIQPKIAYRGSWFWLIFWLIVFFPIAITLFFTRCSFASQQKTTHFHYNGSRFWLCFWLLCFFPISIVLFLLNGMTIEHTLEPETEIWEEIDPKSKSPL